MKILSILLFCLSIFVAPTKADDANDKSPTPAEAEQFKLIVNFSAFAKADHDDQKLKAIIRLGKPFEEKRTLTDGTQLTIQGTLKPAVSGEYPLPLTYSYMNAGGGVKGAKTNFKLELGKAKFWASGSGVVRFHSAVLTKIIETKRNQLPNAAASSPEIGRTANELLAELPFDAQVKREIPMWGKEVDGLQLGISLDFSNRPYRIGETAKFTLAVRNNTEHAVELTSAKSLAQISPKVVHENGDPLSFFQQIYLLGPGNNVYFASAPTKIAPGQVAEVTKAYIDLGPMNGNFNPALDVASGKFQVCYQFDFYLKNQDQARERSKELSSGIVMLEVIPSPSK